MSDPTPARFQFGIRHLLLVMLATAAISGALAPFLRDLNSGQWLRLVTRGLVVMVGGGAISVLFLRRRISIERQLQSIDWTVACQGESWSGSAPLILFSIAAVCLLLVGILDVSIGSAKRMAWEQRMNLEVISMGHSAFASLIAATAMSYLRYPLNRVLIGQTGIVIWMHYFPWTQIACSGAHSASNSVLLNVSGWQCRLYPAPELLPKLAGFIAAKAATCLQPVVRSVAGAAASSDCPEDRY